MQTLQLEHKCGQWDRITAESEDAAGIAAKPRAISVECWLARLIENRSSGAAFKVLLESFSISPLNFSSLSKERGIQV